jgi:hypothetical protein
VITTKEKNAFQSALTLEPAVIRGAAVAVTAAIAVLVGHSIALPTWLDSVLNVYAAFSPIIAGVFIRGAVTPVAALKTAAALATAVTNPLSTVTNRPIPPVQSGTPAAVQSGVAGAPVDLTASSALNKHEG